MLRGVDLFLKLELDDLEQGGAGAEERARAWPRGGTCSKPSRSYEATASSRLLDDLDEAGREGGVEQLLHTIA